MAATTRRARAGGAKPEDARSTKAKATTTLKKTSVQKLWSLVATIAARLCDPSDTLALCLVAAALLVGECFLCALVIVKVPCERRNVFQCIYIHRERERKGKSPEVRSTRTFLLPLGTPLRALSLSLSHHSLFSLFFPLSSSLSYPPPPPGTPQPP